MKISCPICQKDAIFSPSNAYRPFCSERCKTIDTANWASDQYVIVDPPRGREEMAPEDKEPKL